MKNIKYFALSSVLALPVLASAQFDPSGGEAGTLLENILVFINGVLIPFILGIAFLVFVWGMFQYFIAGGANDEAKEKGKSLLTYAILGFVVILVFWGVINLLVSSTGLNDAALDQTVPGVTIPDAG